MKVSNPETNKEHPGKREELEKLREELSWARETITRDRQRISQLNARICRLANSSYVYPGKNRKIESWLGRLEHDFKVLLESKRWRTGNTLVNIFKGDFAGKNPPGAILDAQAVFAEFNTWRRRHLEESRLHAAEKTMRRCPVEEMIDHLEEDVSALARSASYRIGDSLGRAWGLFRPRGTAPGLALERMGALLREYRAARKTESGFSPERMIEMIRDFEILFSGLVASKRWRLGSSLVGAANTLLIRKKSLTAADHIGVLLADFRKGKYYIEGLERNELSFNRLTRKPGQVLFGKYAGHPYKIRKPQDD